jgi:hypothetical protein
MRRTRLSQKHALSLFGVVVLVGLTAPAARAQLLGAVTGAVEPAPSVTCTVNKVEDRVEPVADKVDTPCTNVGTPCTNVGTPCVNTPCTDVDTPEPKCMTISSTTVNAPPVSLAGTAHLSPCVPPGTYIQGEMKTKVTTTVTTCGTRTTLTIDTCGAKVFIPGLGLFNTTEIHVEDLRTDVDNTAVEQTTYASYRYRQTGCGESYRLDIKVKFKLDPISRQLVATCEDVYCDCYIPCCGDVD